MASILGLDTQKIRRPIVSHLLHVYDFILVLKPKRVTRCNTRKTTKDVVLPNVDHITRKPLLVKIRAKIVLSGISHLALKPP